MRKKAIILDLDNTIYPVPAIGDKLFKPVFDLIAETGEHDNVMNGIKKDMMKIPFRIVAKKYGFNQELIDNAIALQEELTYDGPIDTFEDYKHIKPLSAQKFLVTTGFLKMQQSKIKNMGIRQDFTEVHIVDPTITSKKEVFAGIMQRYNYRPQEVLVVGDDPDSEIRAATDLGIDTVLYNPYQENTGNVATYSIKNYRELKDIVE